MDPYHVKLIGLLKDLGDVILQDDADDIWKFSFEGHPSPIHHWQVGAAMKYGAEALKWWLALTEAQRFLGAPTGSVDRLEAQFYAITQR